MAYRTAKKRRKGYGKIPACESAMPAYPWTTKTFPLQLDALQGKGAGACFRIRSWGQVEPEGPRRRPLAACVTKRIKAMAVQPSRLSTETPFFQDLNGDIKRGQVKIPQFQRKFVWKEELFNPVQIHAADRQGIAGQRGRATPAWRRGFQRACCRQDWRADCRATPDIRRGNSRAC